jgi:hypothetical protein
MRRWWAPALVLAAGACSAYFNGIYNSRSAARYGDRQEKRGESYMARDSFLQSAYKAESVLARYKKSRWRPDAIFLAGRGYAMAGECAKAMPYLDQYLEISNANPVQHDRALVARAACLLTGNQLLQADLLLRPLVESRDATVRAEAALWAGRTALALGDPERARQLLSTVPGSAAAWEFIAAAFAIQDYAAAESLMISRAEAGDWRSEVGKHVNALWSAGHRAEVLRIASLYSRSRAPMLDRVDLHLKVSDLAASAGDTAVARAQAYAAARIGVTAAVDAKVQARLLALRIRELDQLSDVEAVLARDSARARGDTLLQRLKDNMLLIRLLLIYPDRYGSHLYLAAELMRDSLHAVRLAHTTFRQVERDYPESPVAGRALLAARALMPESSAVYEARVRELWPGSFAAALLDGEEDMTRTSRRAEEVFMQRTWDLALRQFADSLKERKRLDSLAAVNRGRGQ